MKRRLLMAASGIASLSAVASCSKSPEKTPVSGMTSVDDVKQPQTPSKSPQDAPQAWTSMNFSGISLSLLSSLKGPTRRSGWPPYAVSYDLQTSDTSSSSGSCSPVSTQAPPPTASGRPSVSQTPTSLRTTRRSGGSPGRPAGTIPLPRESPSPGVLQHPGWGGPGCLRRKSELASSLF